MSNWYKFTYTTIYKDGSASTKEKIINLDIVQSIQTHFDNAHATIHLISDRCTFIIGYCASPAVALTETQRKEVERIYENLKYILSVKTIPST